MAHLLVIERWVGASSVLLPQAIRELGHQFTFVTRDLDHYLKSPPQSGQYPLLLADQILTTETNDLPGLLAYLGKHHDSMPFDGVLTACDYYLEQVAEVAALLGLPGASPEGVRTARTKHLMRQALEQAGLPNPSFKVASTWEEAKRAARALGYPLVLKPVDLCAGMCVKFIDSDGDLRKACAALEQFPNNARQQERLPLLLLESYMTGEEVSVESFTVAGETTVIGITDKSIGGFPAFIETGHMFPAPLAPSVAERVSKLVCRALMAVGYDHGVAHTEVKLTPGGPRIVEINVRNAGNYIPELIRYVTGIDLLHIMVQLALGEQPSVVPVETGILSAAIQFLLTPQAARITAVNGVDTLEKDPDIVRVALQPVVGTQVPLPQSNNDYLGHVVAVDRTGPGARLRAQRAMEEITLGFADASDVAREMLA